MGRRGWRSLTAASWRLCPFGFESLHHQKNNKSPNGDLLFWRRRWDLCVLLRNPPSCASSFSRLGPQPVPASTGSALFTAVPFRVRIPAPSKKQQIPRRGFVVFGGDGGIRTHVPLRTTRFRVELVMTTSIRLHNY